MAKNLVRKITATLLFILSVFFIWQLFSADPENRNNNVILIRYGALFLSVLFLYALTYTLQTGEIPDKEKKNVKKENEKEKMPEEEKSKTAEKIKEIVDDLRMLMYPENFSVDFMKRFAKEFFLVQAVMYVKNNDKYKVSAKYAVYPGMKFDEFSEGQGITGQVAKNKKIKILSDIPDDYVQAVSGLGAATPSNIIFIPFIKDNETVAVLEAAAFESFPEDLPQYHSELNKLAEKFKT